MPTDVRPQTRPALVIVLVLTAVVGLCYIGYSVLHPHGVSGGAVASVRGDGIRIVETAQDTNPTNEWTNTYLLIEADGADPVERVASALAANGWIVRREGAAPGLVLRADRKDAGLTLVTYTEFQSASQDVPKVVSAFEHKGTAKSNVFVAILMPY